MLVEFLGWLQHRKTRMFGTADTAPAPLQHTPGSEAGKLSEMKPTSPGITAAASFRCCIPLKILLFCCKSVMSWIAFPNEESEK